MDSNMIMLCAAETVRTLQKGGIPAAPSGTATLLRLSPNHQFCPDTPLAATCFRHPRLSWLDGRCVHGTGTYSPRQWLVAITRASNITGPRCCLMSQLWIALAGSQAVYT